MKAMDRKRILVVERGAGIDWQTEPLLDQEAYAVEILRTGDSALRRLDRAPSPDAVLLNMGATEIGLDCIGKLRSAKPFLKIIALMPNNEAEQVVSAVRMGANVCAWKPCDGQTLHRTIEKCLKTNGVVPVSERLGDVEDLPDGGFFVMASPQMRSLRAQVDQVARVDVPVLVLGESGTGKEVIARLVHRLSRRSKRTFLKVNCAAVPGELLESELFGYERGAFTGAVRSKPGTFEACNHGTLFLDEIAEMPPALQAKLLHVLQDQEFSRLGSCARIKVNVRIVAATNVSVREAIEEKTFRGDLYYRLSAFVFSIPPLRERPEDIPVLLGRYMSHYAKQLGLPARPISNQLLDSCLRHNWPGNVRELENFAKRYLIGGEEGFSLSPYGLAIPVRKSAGPEDLKSHVRHVRDNAEASVISSALEQTNWNRKEAAKLLNISYKSMLSKIRQYSLDRVSGKQLDEYDFGGETPRKTRSA